MRQRILDDLKEAMKNQDKELLSVIRMVKADISLEEIKLKRALTDSEIISIISKQIKTRKESIIEFTKGSREDLVNKTEKEIEILKRYLPVQLSEQEVDEIINDLFEQLKPTGMKDMGKIMKIISEKINGQYDMSEVSKKIKEKLS